MDWQIGNRLSAIMQGSLARPVEGAEHLEPRTLSAAARSDDGHEFVFRDAKVHAAQSVHLTIVEFFFQSDAFENEVGHGAHPVFARSRGATVVGSCHCAPTHGLARFFAKS